MTSFIKRNDLLLARNPICQYFGLTNKQSTVSSNPPARTYRFPTYVLTLMNHGECEDDLSRQFTGWQDSKLSSYGIEQAKKAGKIMSTDETHFHIAYTSELARAQETVKHVLEPLLVQPKVFATWRLNDRHVGDLTGYNRSQMALVHGERKLKEWLGSYGAMPPIIKVENPAYKKIMDNMSRKHISAEQVPRSESQQMVYNRVIPYWENIIVPSLKMRNKIIIIAHNDPLCALIRRFAELSEQETQSIRLPPAIPFMFTLDNHMRIIKGRPTKANYVGAVNKSTTASAPPPLTALAKQKGVPPTTQLEQQLVAQHHLQAQVNDDTKPTSRN